MPSEAPSESDRVDAIVCLLAGLGDGHDVFEVAVAVAELHPRYNTFPGEVYMRLAAALLISPPWIEATRSLMNDCSRTISPSVTFVAGKNERSSMRSCPVVDSVVALSLICSARLVGVRTTIGATPYTPLPRSCEPAPPGWASRCLSSSRSWGGITVSNFRSGRSVSAEFEGSLGCRGRRPAGRAAPTASHASGSAASSGYERRHYVGGMPVERLSRPVISHCGSRVSMGCRFLNIPQGDAGVERGGYERMA